MRRAGKPIAEIARVLGMARKTIYAALDRAAAAAV
jgi:DNA-binding CsgD family transcriptional regulator